MYAEGLLEGGIVTVCYVCIYLCMCISALWHLDWSGLEWEWTGVDGEEVCMR